MFQICIDADHVNGKGLLKQGTGNTGKKHEEREGKKWTKQTTGNEATDRVRVHARFFPPFSKKKKKAMIIPSVPWLAWASVLHQKFKCIPERNANEPAKVFPLTSSSFWDKKL